MIALSVSIFVIFAPAQDENAEFEKKTKEALGKIPLNGKKIEHFVPAGWEIYTQSEGDLNADGLTDYALGLAPIFRSAGDDLNDTVVVLFGERNERLQLVGVNGNLISTDFSALLAVRIQKGVLSASASFGNNYAADVSYSFRYDKAAGKLMLIGFDYEAYTRLGNDDAQATSYNFLTGIREDTTKYIDRSKNAKGTYGRFKRTRTRIKRVKIPFERARLNYRNDGKAALPY